MKKTGQNLHGYGVMNYAATAIEQFQLYCTAHPDSPSAVRRPQLFFRSELWIALLGLSMEEGIVGIRPTVAAALRAFDAQYLAGLRPPNKALKLPTRPGRAVHNHICADSATFKHPERLIGPREKLHEFPRFAKLSTSRRC
jgi:hypothetical protein